MVFEEKWQKRFRPDLNFPTHIKRRIYQIYKRELFEDVEKAIEKKLTNEYFYEKFNGYKNFKELNV